MLNWGVNNVLVVVGGGGTNGKDPNFLKQFRNLFNHVIIPSEAKTADINKKAEPELFSKRFVKITEEQETRKKARNYLDFSKKFLKVAMIQKYFSVDFVAHFLNLRTSTRYTITNPITVNSEERITKKSISNLIIFHYSSRLLEN